MGIRNGAQYLESLRDDRYILIDGERVADVTKDPRLRGAARSLAALYDMQHDPALKATLTYESPSTGDRVGLSFIEPTSRADLKRRRAMIKVWMDATMGMLGRSPDFMNCMLAGMASAASDFARGGENFGTNVRAYYEHCRENDVAMTHSLVNPQVDRSRPVEQQQKDLAAKIVKETDAGIVVDGARMVTTLAPYSNDLVVMPSTYIANSREAEPYAFGFSVPVATPGLRFICRPSLAHAEAASVMDYPLSTRFDESDSMAVFDNVLVPWERVFIHRNAEICNDVFNRTFTMNQIMHQFSTKNLAKAEYMMGLAFCIVRSTNIDQHLHVQNMMAELIQFTEMTRACLVASEAEAFKTPFDTVAPATMPLWVVRMMFPKLYARMGEIIQIVGAGGLVAVPSYADLSGGVAHDMARYFQAANLDSPERVKLFRLAFDSAVSGFAGRQQLYERYYSGDPIRLAAALYSMYNKAAYMERIWAALDALENVTRQAAAS